jgi:predicted O-methyltransferase YrrM
MSEVEKIFINDPLSLMPREAKEFIVDYVEKHNLNNILEIGTFAAGTAYQLAKALPHKTITTVDINEFERYFTVLDHAEHLKHNQKRYPNVNLQPDSIKKIQQIYKKNCHNLNLIEGDWHLIDVSSFDCILIDGDHTDDAVLSDLQYAFKNMKIPGTILIDDFVFPTIREVTTQFCNEHNLELAAECQNTKFNSYTGESLTGPDLGIIQLLARK